MQDYGSYVDIRVAPLDPNLRILGGTWEETVEDGQSTYRFTGKKVRASFLNFSSDSYGYGAPSELLHEIYVGDTLIWADGLEISDVLGKTENWSRVTFYRAKERLKGAMEQDGEV